MKRRIAFLLAVFAGCVPEGTTEWRNRQFLQDADRLYLQGQYVDAAGHYLAYLDDNPSDPDRARIRLMAGRCYLGAGRPDPALRLLDQAVADQPEGAVRLEILFCRGVALLQLNEPSRALDSLRTAAIAPVAERDRTIPSDEFHYEYGVALCRTGDWKGGQLELASVSARGPYGEKALLCRSLPAFSVQVGAFAEEGRARDEAARLKGLVRPFKGRGEKPLYLVLVGSFPRYDDAQREAERLKRSYPDAFVVP